jgi:hypothetical protein
MARESVMSTPIFDELLREMAQRAEPRPTTPAQPEPEKRAPAEQQRTARGRRHRAE